MSISQEEMDAAAAEAASSPSAPSAPAPAPSPAAAVAASAAATAGMGFQAPIQRGSSTVEIPVKCSSLTRAFPAEGHLVPPGASVEVYPDPSNTQPVFVSDVSATAAMSGPRAVFAAGSTARRYAGIRNTAQFWVAATVAGEGVLIRVIEAER